MLTYNGDNRLKADLVAEIRLHQDADQIMQGTYGRGEGREWRGCAVGCAIHSLNIIRGTDFLVSDHEALERYGLWPEWLARVQDAIFEGLSSDKAVKWPLRFAEAVPVGVDLDTVKWQFCAFLMQDNLDRVLALDLPGDLKKQVCDAIRSVLQLYKDALQTGVWDESAARSAARSAESAARSARSAALWSAVWFAAESIVWSARSAARSVAESTAWSAAQPAAYEKYADKLIVLLAAA